MRERAIIKKEAIDSLRALRDLENGAEGMEAMLLTSVLEVLLDIRDLLKQEIDWKNRPVYDD